jgi:multiple sugar transport system substrate-binding protein
MRRGLRTHGELPRRWRCGALLLAVVVVAGGCTGRSDGGKGPELVWAVGGLDVIIANDVADRWNKSHPDGPSVRVEALAESTDERRQLISIELNARMNTFDILTLDVIWTGEFAENGWLADLEDLRDQVEAASQTGPLQSGLWRGKLWAAPFTSDAGILYYRSDLVPEPPRSWPELMAVGLDVARRSGIAPFVGQGDQYEGMVVNFLEYFWGAGGTLFDEDATEVRFDEGPALQALEFMRLAYGNGFFHPQFSRMKENDALTAFASGGAVFMRNWPYAYRELTGEGSQVAGKFRIERLPTFDGTGTASALGGLNLGVSRFSPSRKAAKDFVRFASTDKEVQLGLARGDSRAPTLRGAYADLAGEPLMVLLNEVLPVATPRPPVPSWSEISDEIQQQVFPAYTGQRKPEQAVNEIRTFLELAVEER